MTIEDKREELLTICANNLVCPKCPIYPLSTAGKDCNLLSGDGDYIGRIYAALHSQGNPDNVNHPAHYSGKHECIEVMRVLFGDEAVKAFCRCNSFKYRFRADRKNGEEDIKKAEWYEDYLFSMENGNGE